MTRKKVEVVARSTIVPSYPTASFFHPFSHVVAATKDMYMHTVYHFAAGEWGGTTTDAAAAGASAALIKGLKISLSAVLSHYPLLCGRLRERPCGGLTIKCNDAGVRFLEAVTESSLAEWIEGSDGLIQKELCASETSTTDYAFKSLAMVQFTEFCCGGLAIGLSWSLAVADSFSTNLFMKAWGEVHRGDSISIPPLIHTHTDDISHHTPPSPAPFIAHIFFPQNQHPPEAQQLRSLRIHFSEKTLQQFLEAEVQNDSPEGGSPQNDNLLVGTAWLWRSICAARGQPTGCMIVRGSRRNLPEGFFGMALQVVTVSADCAAGEFSQTVNLLRKRLAEEGESEASAITRDLADDAIVCFWVDAPFEEAEFSFGKAIQVTYGMETPAGRESMVILPGSRGGVDDFHAIAAAISIQPQHSNIFLQKLKDDSVIDL